MRIPVYWASARATKHAGKRRATLQRWGWSDDSQAAAQEHAQLRLQEALDQAEAHWPLPPSFLRREHKVPYNGAEGLPIREEIVERHGSEIITRNSYGALCLNTPDVMFVDIDEDDWNRAPRMPPWPRFLLGVFVAMAWSFLVWDSGDAHTVVGFLWKLVVSLVIIAVARQVLWKIKFRRMGGLLGLVDKALGLQLSREPGRWAIYRTPGGIRLMALHRTFDPTSEESQSVMEALLADKLYAAMCRRQACYRARVSPKPWRIPGFERLRSPVWPVEGEALERRQQWVGEYDRLREPHAACQWIKEVGGPGVDPRVIKVQELHDELCSARTGKKMG